MENEPAPFAVNMLSIGEPRCVPGLLAIPQTLQTLTGSGPQQRKAFGTQTAARAHENAQAKSSH